MSDKKAQPNIHDMLALAYTFKFEDPDKQQQCQLMLKRLNIQIGDRSFEDLDDDIDFLNDLLTVIDLINEAQASREPEYGDENFNLEFSNLGNQNEAPMQFCGGKYYRMNDEEEGEYLMDSQKNTVTPYFKKIHHVFESDGELYIIGKDFDGDSGIFNQDRELLPIPTALKDSGPMNIFKVGQDFYQITKHVSGGRRHTITRRQLFCLNDPQKEFDSYQGLMLVDGHDFCVGVNLFDNNIEIINLKTGKVISAKAGRARFSAIVTGPDGFVIKATDTQDIEVTKLIDHETGEVITTSLESDVGRIMRGAGEDFIEMSKSNYRDSHGQKINNFSELPNLIVVTIGRTLRGQPIFVAVDKETSSGPVIIDKNGEEIFRGDTFRAIPDRVFVTESGYIFYDEEKKTFYNQDYEPIYLAPGQVENIIAKRDHVFVFSYDRASQKAVGHIVKI